MSNEGVRRGSDGKLYPRLRVRKFQDGSPLPWHVEKLYGPSPFFKRDLVRAVEDHRLACDLAGAVLDEGIRIESARPKITTFVEAHKVVSPRVKSNMGRYDPELFLS